MLKFLIAIGLLLLANNSADAQDQPALCSESSSMTFDATQQNKNFPFEKARQTFFNGNCWQIFATHIYDQSNHFFSVAKMSGVWWEVARKPSLPVLGCVKVNFTEIQSENILEIATTNIVSTTYLWVNQTMYANISLRNGNGNSNGYNISYIDGITTTKYTVYKLLDTDYKNYALFCGYTNATNDATSFGIILTRERYPNATQLTDIEAAATSKYSNFASGSLPLVTQSPTCYAAGAATQYSMFATTFAFLYAILINVI